MIHCLAHRLGWNMGYVAAWTVGGKVMVGFICKKCGGLTGVHDASDVL